jgi:SAM-dependent methyltransferase
MGGERSIETSATPSGTTLANRQDEINRAVYYSPRVYRSYLAESLTAAESSCLSKYRLHIEHKDVLDIGVGAGRTARYLAPLARRYEAVDYSPVMVDYVKRTMPQISVRQADFRELTVFADQSFDFILATDNVIDALSHSDRMRALGEASRLLRFGGVLAFSSHNLRYKKAFSGPRLLWSWNPVRLAANCVGYVLSMWNYRRVAPLRTATSEYALLNDPGHRYACLHYYAARSTVSSQLESAGLSCIDAFDRSGRPLVESADDSEISSILYVAERPRNEWQSVTGSTVTASKP